MTRTADARQIHARIEPLRARVDVRGIYEASSDALPLGEGDALPIPDLRLSRCALTNSPEADLLLAYEGGLLITCDSVQHGEPSPLMSAAASLATHVMGFRLVVR